MLRFYVHIILTYVLWEPWYIHQVGAHAWLVHYWCPWWPDTPCAPQLVTRCWWLSPCCTTLHQDLGSLQSCESLGGHCWSMRVMCGDCDKCLLTCSSCGKKIWWTGSPEVSNQGQCHCPWPFPTWKHTVWMLSLWLWRSLLLGIHLNSVYGHGIHSRRWKNATPHLCWQ